MPPQKLPGVITLFKQGIEIYKEERTSIIQLTLLNLVADVIGIGCIFVAVFVGALLYEGPTPPLVDIPIVGLVVLVLIILFMFIVARLTLALMYVIRNHDLRVTTGAAWKETRSHTWPFIGTSILSALAILAPMVIAAIIFIPLSFLFENSGSSVLAIIPIIVVCIASWIVLGTWLAFSLWVFVDEGLSGVSALKESKQLTHHRFASIFWRLVGIIVVTLVAQGVLTMVLQLVPGSAAHAISQLIVMTISQLVLVPISMAATFSLYRELKPKA